MRKRTISTLLLCLLVCVVSAGSVSEYRASAITMSSITSDSIKEKEQQISQAKDEKKQLQSGLTNLQKIKKELESQRANLKNYVIQLDANLQ